MNHNHADRPDDGARSNDDDARQDLKATTDSIQADLGRLKAIEDAKEALNATDVAVDRLSDEAVEIAERIRRQTRAQRQLSEELG